MTRLAERHQLSFWHAMVMQGAAQLGCARLWSEDLSSGQVYRSVRVEDPFAAGAE